jgi:hypothetical protein
VGKISLSLEVVKQHVKKYFTNNESKKTSEKEVKKLALILKEHYEIGDKFKYPDIGVQVHYQRKESSTTNTPKLIESLKELGKKNPKILEAIKVITIEQVDEDKVMELIANDLIELETLEECIETVVSGALMIKKL